MITYEEKLKTKRLTDSIVDYLKQHNSRCWYDAIRPTEESPLFIRNRSTIQSRGAEPVTLVEIRGYGINMVVITHCEQTMPKDRLAAMVEKCLKNVRG